MDAQCSHCGVIRKLCRNGYCRGCLRGRGLRECPVCLVLQPVDRAFEQRKGVCRQCRHPLAHLTRQERALDAAYRRKYGISYDTYLRISASQGGLCAICKCRPKKKLVVDHAHDTGEVRGLLCAPCNSGIGLLRDSPEVLLGGVDYLARSALVPHQPDEPLSAGERRDFSRDVAVAELQFDLAAARQRAKVAEADLAVMREQLSETTKRAEEFREGAVGMSKELLRAWLAGVLKILEEERPDLERLRKAIRRQLDTSKPPASSSG